MFTEIQINADLRTREQVSLLPAVISDEFLDRIRDERPDADSAVFEYWTNDVLQRISEASDDSDWVLGDVVLLQTSVHEGLDVAVHQLLDVRMLIK